MKDWIFPTVCVVLTALGAIILTGCPSDPPGPDEQERLEARTRLYAAGLAAGMVRTGVVEADELDALALVLDDLADGGTPAVASGWLEDYLADRGWSGPEVAAASVLLEDLIVLYGGVLDQRLSPLGSALVRAAAEGVRAALTLTEPEAASYRAALEAEVETLEAVRPPK